MKITCPKQRLLEAISQVQGAVSPKTTLPILANVYLRADKNLLSFITTDLDIGIEYSIEVEVSEPGTTTLPARRLFGIIRELPEGDVNIEVNSSNIAFITCGSVNYKVVGLAGDEFPKLPAFPKENCVEIPQSLLKEIITKTQYAVSRDESRYVLNGLYLIMKSNKIIMVATDGRRLAHIEKTIDLPKGMEIEAIIPSKTVTELLKLLDEEMNVRIVLAKNQILFKLPSCKLVSRLIEGRFPNYKQVIPKSLEKKINLSRQELLSGIKRSILITNDRSNSIKLNFSKNNLTISANTPDVGESRESLDIAYKGKDIEIALNPSYVVDVLKNVDDEEVLLEITDGANPGIIRSGSEFLYVIMPMRLN